MNVRKDFPLLARHPHIIYLDNACTSLKPAQVIAAESAYYTELGACAGRSAHSLARRTNEKIDEAKAKVARFVGAEPEGLVWTRNTTEGLNFVANSFDFSKRKKVVTTVLEHHSVLLPFMRLRDKGAIQLEVLGCDEKGAVAMGKWEKAVDKNTALVVTHNWTNSLGTGQDVKNISSRAHDNGARVCIDGAQGVPHHKTDMKKDGYDFLCFSGHKMLGPTGIGALAMKKEMVASFPQFLVGGGTVKTVKLDKIEQMPDNSRFEAGIQDYAGILGFAAACDYLKSLGMDRVEAHERALANEMLGQMKAAGATVYGPDSASAHGALYSFNFPKGKPHDVALMLDKLNIAVRSGFFCAQPALEAIGAKDGAVRVSGYVYNTVEEIRKFGESLKGICQIYG